MFDEVAATEAEHDEARAGDELVAPADVVMDRAFTVPGTAEDVWPWIAQLGKWRAGWYLPRRAERFIPTGRRAIRALDPRWQPLVVGDVIPDYGGRHETFTVAQVSAPHTLVYSSQRRGMRLSWSITVRPVANADAGANTGHTRVLLRLRLGPVERVWLAKSAGGLIDVLTIAGLAAGLRERLLDANSSG